MKTLLFDLRATQPLAYGHHGGAEYARAVFRHLVASPGALAIKGFYDAGRALPDDVRAAADSAGLELVGLRSGADELQKFVHGERAYRFYSALPYEYGSLDCGDMDVVMTIHGLRPIEMPTDAYSGKYSSTRRQIALNAGKRVFAGAYRRYKTRQFAALLRPKGRRRRLIGPSEHTKYSLLLNFPSVSPDDVLVRYSPCTSVCARTDTSTDPLRQLGLTERGYILLTSSNRWIKNSYRAICAIQGLFDQRPDLAKRIVAVGGAPARAPADWRRRHLFLQQVDEPTLASLYRHAFVLLYPSLNEGFGYPPLESMSYGTPVIAGASTSIPEICGDGVLYASPRSISEMQGRLLWLLTDERAWQDFAARGRRRFEHVGRVQQRALVELCDLLVDPDA
jgi:glycosyltransferase involved in cell wall biosynthesis